MWVPPATEETDAAWDARPTAGVQAVKVPGPEPQKEQQQRRRKEEAEVGVEEVGRRRLASR